jgi:hypothetical protein
MGNIDFAARFIAKYKDGEMPYERKQGQIEIKLNDNTHHFYRIKHREVKEFKKWAQEFFSHIWLASIYGKYPVYRVDDRFIR